jgi:hypothetical protein
MNRSLQPAKKQSGLVWKLAKLAVCVLCAPLMLGYMVFVSPLQAVKPSRLSAPSIKRCV